MATDNEKISEAVEGALAFIKKNAPEEHSKLIADDKLKDSITAAARKAAGRKWGSLMSLPLNHNKTSVSDLRSIYPKTESGWLKSAHHSNIPHGNK